MELEFACHGLCDDISQLLLEGPGKPSLQATFAAGRATRSPSGCIPSRRGSAGRSALVLCD